MHMLIYEVNITRSRPLAALRVAFTLCCIHQTCKCAGSGMETPLGLAWSWLGLGLGWKHVRSACFAMAMADAGALHDPPGNLPAAKVTGVASGWGLRVVSKPRNSHLPTFRCDENEAAMAMAVFSRRVEPSWMECYAFPAIWRKDTPVPRLRSKKKAQEMWRRLRYAKIDAADVVQWMRKNAVLR